MHIFLVVSTDDSVKELISKVYEDRNYRALDDIWVIADKELEPIKVSEKLGIGEAFGKNSGIIVKADKYYGHFNGTLWQQIDHWRSAER